jgi:hypothetical protein
VDPDTFRAREWERIAKKSADGFGDCMQAIGALAAEVSTLRKDMAQGFERIASHVQHDIDREANGVRERMASLPNMVAHAVEEAKEITKVRELRAVVRRQRRLGWAVIPPVIVIVVAALVLHFGFHLG